MNMQRVYLDYSATTPLDPRVLEAMLPNSTQIYGNASSVHWHGRQAKYVLEESRESIACSIGAAYDEVLFTSGGTEADNYALQGVRSAYASSGKKHVIISSIEHHAVLHTAEEMQKNGLHISFVPVDVDGVVHPEDVASLITNRTCLISVMHANNEIGSIQPIAEIGAIAKSAGVLFHVDAVQSFGKIPCRVDDLQVDLLSLSAHKIYGPKGIGALYVRKGTLLRPLFFGGAQEQNRRAGTEAVPSVAGFARAASLALESQVKHTSHIETLKYHLLSRLTKEIEGIAVNGDPAKTLPHIVSVSFDSQKRQTDGDALIMGLDVHGVSVTSGSACTSGSLQPSHVLLAMGRDEATARATIRFSLSHLTTSEEIDYAIDALQEVLKTIK
jgi:cysteine desulfurase